MYFWKRKNGIRESDEKSAGCEILVKKERECRIRTPFQTLMTIGKHGCDVTLSMFPSII